MSIQGKAFRRSPGGAARTSAAGDILSTVFLVLAFLSVIASSAFAAPVLEVTPITWNIVGLDSNSPAGGPYRFPVGARICNTGDTDATNVSAAFLWDDGQGVFVGDLNADDYINLRAGSLSSINIGSLAAGNCSNAYFEVEVTRTADAFDKTRRYHIMATDPFPAMGVSPRPRELYVERLISQNRNSVTNIQLDGTIIPAGGTMNLLVGNTYEIKLYGGTATQGYEQFEAFINFPNTIFQILSVSTDYSANTSVYVDDPNDTLYADACLWDNDPNSPNYRSCIGAAGKAGGSNVVTAYMVTVIDGAGTTETLNSLLYDFSGSSFHYNADYGVGARIVTISGPSSMTIAKLFNPKAIAPGGTSTMTFKINNPTAETITGVNFADAFPSGLAVHSAPGVSYSGCGAGTFSPPLTGGETSLSFVNGTIEPNSVCSIALTVTAPEGDYVNTSGNLFIYGTTDTGNSATDTLTASSTPACIPGQTLVTWTVPAGATAPPDSGVGNPAINTTGSSASSYHFPVAKQSIVSAAQSPDRTPLGDDTSWNTWGYKNDGGYVEFVVDTQNYTDVSMTFHVYPDSNGPSTLTVTYVGNGAGTVATYTVPATLTAGAWNMLTIDLSSLASTTGSTTIRISGTDANNDNSGSNMFIDDVSFTGCAIPPPPPIISKSFSPDSIAKGATSTLSLTISNTQSGNRDLSGISFTDDFPAGLEINNPNDLSGGCGGGTITADAGTQTISLIGASLAAGTSCNFSVSVKGTAAGNYENVTSFLTTTQTGSTTSYAHDDLMVIAPPDLDKSFSPVSIFAGQTSTLTFSIMNPNQSIALSGIDFTDTLPAGLTVADGGPIATCGGSLTTTAPSTISFSGASLSENAECSFNVVVTGISTGSQVNTTSAVTSLEGGNGSPASAALHVTDPQPLLGLNKQISSDNAIDTIWLKFLGVTVPDDIYYRVTVSNDGELPLDNVAVSDPAVNMAACSPSLPVSLSVGESASCVVGPVSITSTPIPDPFVNTASATTGTYTPPIPVASSARYGTKSLLIDKGADKSSFTAAGETLTYSYLVTNNGGYPLLEPLTVSDDKSVNESCPSVNTAGDLDNYLDPGESITCNATYTVTGEDMLTGFVTNEAYASADRVLSNTDTVTVNSPGSDLVITKTDGLTSAVPGQIITYTIVASNDGPSNATGATVADTFPGTLTGVSWTCSAGGGATCTASGSGNISDMVNIPVGGSVAYSVNAAISSAAAGILTNTATVSSPAGITDPVPGNNSSTDTDTLAPSADLSVAKADNPDPVVTGQNLSYTITVNNAGPSDATNIIVTDTLPAGVSYQGASGTGWSCSQEAGVVTCTRVSLSVGNAPDITIMVTAPSQGGSIANNASVSSDTLDPNLSNNSATAMTTVQEPSIFDPPSGFKTVNAAGYPELVWRMVWINNGNADAVAVVITDAIPANTTYVAGSLVCEPRGSSQTDPGQCSYDSGNNMILWQGTIAADPGSLNESQALNEVVITFRTTMSTSVTQVENQGCAQIPGGDTSCTDDPATPSSGDPTVWTRSPGAVAVPTISEWGFIILVVLQGIAALYFLRRRVRG